MKFRRALHPALQAHANVGSRYIMHISVLGFCLESLGAVDSDENIHSGGPLGMRFKVNFEVKSLVIYLGGRAGGDLSFAHEALPLVAENEPIFLHPPIEFARSIKFLVLHLEQISKIG